MMGAVGRHGAGVHWGECTPNPKVVHGHGINLHGIQAANQCPEGSLTNLHPAPCTLQTLITFIVSEKLRELAGMPSL